MIYRITSDNIIRPYIAGIYLFLCKRWLVIKFEVFPSSQRELTNIRSRFRREMNNELYILAVLFE